MSWKLSTASSGRRSVKVIAIRYLWSVSIMHGLSTRYLALTGDETELSGDPR